MNNGIAIRKALARPEVVKKMREQAKRAWADPEMRRERILAMRRAGARKRGRKAEEAATRSQKKRKARLVVGP